MTPDTYAAPVQPVSRPRVRIRARLEADSAAAILAVGPFAYLVAVLAAYALTR